MVNKKNQSSTLFLKNKRAEVGDLTRKIKSTRIGHSGVSELALSMEIDGLWGGQSAKQVSALGSTHIVSDYAFFGPLVK